MMVNPPDQGMALVMKTKTIPMALYTHNTHSIRPEDCMSLVLLVDPPFPIGSLYNRQNATVAQNKPLHLWVVEVKLF